MLKKIKLVTHPVLTGNAVFVDHEIFGRYGLQIELHEPQPSQWGSGPGGKPMITPLLDGTAHYTNVLGTPLPAAVMGQGLKYLASYQNTGVELFARPEIRNLADLSGRAVASSSPMWQFNLERALRACGVEPSRVRFHRGYPVGTLVPKVLDGTVDAITVVPPDTAAAIGAGLKLIFRYGDVSPVPVYALMATEKRLREDPQEARQLLRALSESVDRFMRDRPRGIELVGRLGTPAELAGPAYDLTCGYTTPVSGIPEQVQSEWLANAKKLAGMQEEEVGVSGVFDFGILRSIEERQERRGN